jgi:hypothetical protein
MKDISTFKLVLAISALFAVTAAAQPSLGTSALLEGWGAGSDVLPAVLPATVNLLAPFAPTSDEPWLTITGITNGVASFTFGATTSNRTAHMGLLGQPISITEIAAPITQEPASATVCSGSPAIFTVTALGDVTWPTSGR